MVHFQASPTNLISKGGSRFPHCGSVLERVDDLSVRRAWRSSFWLVWIGFQGSLIFCGYQSVSILFVSEFYRHNHVPVKGRANPGLGLRSPDKCLPYL